MKPNQKLELTWIGKGHEPKLELRILIEQPEYSYGDSNSGNMLIQGDNLLALKQMMFGRTDISAILEEARPERKKGNGKADSSTGRPGMEQWAILVLGVVRLGLNIDYDRLHELVNQHTTLRQMLGHNDWTDKTTYELQTIKDNVRLFTPELLDRINHEVVLAGQALVKKKTRKISCL